MAKLVTQLNLSVWMFKRPKCITATFSAASNSSRLFSTEFPTKDLKKAKAVIVKRIHRENREIFGELLETKPDKEKRVKRLDKLKKKEMKTNTVSSILTLDTKEYELEPPTVPTKTEMINPNDSMNIENNNTISSHKYVNAEINWTMKNFPQRTKIISRFNPEVTIQSFESPSKVNVQFLKKDSYDVSEMSVKEMKKVPSINQFLASLELTDEMKPSSEKNIVRKAPNQIIDTNDYNEIVLEDELFVDEVTELIHSGQPVQNDIEDITSIVNLKLAKKLKKPETIQVQPASNDNTTESAVGTVAKLTKLSYDNPERKNSEDYNSNLIPSTQNGIISLQYDFKNTLNSPRLPSVSKILQATMSPEQAEILKKWQQKMIEQLGEDGFKRYKEALFHNGKELHKNIQSVLSGTPREHLTIEDSIFGHWNSLQTILPQIQNVQVLESLVVHPKLEYCGIVDCVAFHRDKLVLIDWKTSEKRKSFVAMTYDTPLQISAYIGALNYDPQYSFKITEGLIVIAYQDGTTCQQFHLNSDDLKKYWNQWLLRLNLFKSKAATETTV